MKLSETSTNERTNFAEKTEDIQIFLEQKKKEKENIYNTVLTEDEKKYLEIKPRLKALLQGSKKGERFIFEMSTGISMEEAQRLLTLANNNNVIKCEKINTEIQALETRLREATYKELAAELATAKEKFENGFCKDLLLVIENNLQNFYNELEVLLKQTDKDVKEFGMTIKNAISKLPQVTQMEIGNLEHKIEATEKFKEGIKKLIEIGLKAEDKKDFEDTINRIKYRLNGFKERKILSEKI
ncbi:MAG: hypothetical protein PHT40_02215 [Patescibacteria group bacterium]|nr:hypothetical protein [Patescibacteria group bacterium]